MAKILSRPRAWLREHLTDLGLLAAVLALLVWSWQGPPDSTRGDLSAAARTAISRHLDAVEPDTVHGAANARQRTATAVPRIGDPG